MTQIFRLSLKQDLTRDAHGNTLYFVKGLREELLEQNESLLLKTSSLDQALTEAASNLGANLTPLDYLLSCWKRVSKAFRTVKSGDTNSPKYTILQEARRLCMSYCIFAITMPEMFGQDNAPENALARHLLIGPENETGLDFDFLNEAVSRFDEDESIKDAIVAAAEQISAGLAVMTLNDDHRPYIAVSRYATV